MDDLHDDQAAVRILQRLVVLTLRGEEGMIFCAVQLQSTDEFQSQLLTILRGDSNKGGAEFVAHKTSLRQQAPFKESDRPREPFSAALRFRWCYFTRSAGKMQGRIPSKICETDSFRGRKNVYDKEKTTESETFLREK